MTASHLAHLNPEQRRAVEFGGADLSGAPPLLIIAGAGSGKTNTLAHRVAHLVVSGIDSRRIMLLTFSRRAAAEMTRRVERITAHALRGKAGLTHTLTWSGTFHAIGARLLREYAPQIGLDRAFTIHDREDSADLLNLIRHDLDLSKMEKRFPTKGTCLAIYSRAVNAETPLGEVLAAAFPWCATWEAQLRRVFAGHVGGKQSQQVLGYDHLLLFLARKMGGAAFPWCATWEAQLRRLFAAYVEAKQRQHVLDYDDLLLYWAQMMAVPSIAEDVADRFDHVLVDEYQDTNRLQASILLALKPNGTGLTVVGDDAQSIYSFRAATVRNILDFPGHFTPRAAVVTLDRNYRSTQPILAAANAVIEQAQERFTKNLWSERASAERPRLVNVRDEIDQARYVAAKVLEQREAGVALKAQAVLFRTSHHSGPLELELTRRNIPFVKFGGLKFLEASHVKDVLAFLRWAEHLRDRAAGFRVAQLLPGVGPATAGRLLDLIMTGADPMQVMAAFIAPAAAAAHWPSFVDAVALVHGKTTSWPAELDLICRWYAPHLERIHDDAVLRQADLVQLAQIASTYTSRERFLTELTLDPPDATSDEAGTPLLDEDYLVLSTIHSAKGQEWKSVLVLNVIDGCIPSDLGTGSRAEIDEERRLLYVAMTRAKDHLHLVMPQRFFAHQQKSNGDRHMYAARTRFITAPMLDRFESCAWPSGGARTAGHRPAGEAVDIAMRLRRMWS